MSEGVLIVYASRCGSTGEVARAVGQELTAQDQVVDVRRAQDAPDPSGYQAVVVGSAVRFGKWLPEAVEFVKKNQFALGRVPTAFFAVHAWALDDSPASQRQRQAYLEPVRRIVTPKREAFFAGKLDLARLSFGERALAKLVRAPDGDLRDWDAIQGWAQRIVKGLM